MVTVLTYGTYDTLHFGHIKLLQRAKSLGDRLVVGLSTDEFNARKGKASYFCFEERKSLLESITCVDLVIPENDWDQKASDVINHGANIFTMGDDWVGEFDYLQEFCTVTYLPRTPAISSTLIKQNITPLKKAV